jgi:hypothetical protein
MITALIVASIGVITVLLGAAYLNLRARAASEYSMAVIDFYDSIKPLLEDDEVPIEILDQLAFYNDMIDDSTVVRFLVQHKTSGRRNARARETALRHNKLSTEFFARRPELEPAYGAATATWFFAVTALSPVLGRLARVIWDGEQGAKQAPAAFRNRKGAVDGPPSGAIAHM